MFYKCLIVAVFCLIEGPIMTVRLIRMPQHVFDRLGRETQGADAELHGCLHGEAAELTPLAVLTAW